MLAGIVSREQLSHQQGLWGLGSSLTLNGFTPFSPDAQSLFWIKSRGGKAFGVLAMLEPSKEPIMEAGERFWHISRPLCTLFHQDRHLGVIQ